LGAEQPATVPELLLAPAGAAFVVARFYTYDPYYAPTLRRMSEDGFVAGWWVFALVSMSLLAGVLATARTRLGMTACLVVLVLSALTAIAEGGGH
jgi:hypothetical protein